MPKQITTINNPEFAEYINAIKKSGSYLLTQETIDALQVNGVEVSGRPDDVNVALSAYQFILQNRD